MTKDDSAEFCIIKEVFYMKRISSCRLPALLLLLVMLSACSGDMTITDQNGKAIEVSSVGKHTYTFNLADKPVIESRWENPFIDVKENDWFYDAVRYCYENGLMNGTTEITFSPALPTSRAMIVSILWRLEGSPDTGSVTFADVSADQYYADAVAWAASEGIVSGYDEKTFAPDDAVTREQMAAILYRYGNYKGWDMSEDVSLDGFSDAYAVSGYAQPAIYWAASHGIISGMEDNLLAPQSDATRAQVASILMNLCKNFAV